ncbi:alpha/beta fold hydrolase [Shimia biformata]|uniref:alpha/beta fold hydrolase n=1 Tax=Shimia biformata TaxID=1294299 RepID=UPI001951AE8C|nr:alpha/beta fold hydrolase [Shimia biformata]
MTGTVFTRDFGQGARQALALHCSLAHAGAWRGMGEALADVATLRAMDFPAHGQSADCPPEAFSEASFDSAEAVLLSMDAPVDLIGHSWGGYIALRLALAHPNHVRSLVLYEPIISAIVAGSDRMEAERSGIETVIAHVDRGEHEQAARAFMRVWGDGRKWADLPEQLRRACTHGIAHVMACQPDLLEDAKGILGDGGISTIDKPVLVVDGALSPGLAHEVQDRLAARIPGAQRLTIAGAGHMGPISHAHELAAATRDFWRAS